jgi:hypothetical protein
MAGAHALIIGGTGALGSLVAVTLRDSGWRVTVASRRPRSSDVRLIDPQRPADIPAVTADADIIVSTNPGPDLAIESTIVASGGLCISPATLCANELAPVERIAAPKGTLIPHAGLTPGFSTLILADMLRRIGTPRAVTVGLSFSARGASGPGGRRWVNRLFSQVCATHSVIRTFSNLGRRRCFRLPLQTEGWLPELPADVDQGLEFCMAERSLSTLFAGLKRLHLWHLLPGRLIVRPHSVGPAEPTNEPIAQWAYAMGTIAAASHVCLVQGDYRTTACAVAILADKLLTRIDAGEMPRGVVRLQSLLTVDDLALGLARAGVAFERSWPR